MFQPDAAQTPEGAPAAEAPSTLYQGAACLEYDDFTRNWRLYCPEQNCGQMWDVGRLASSVLARHFTTYHREIYEGTGLGR